jgi:tRNA(fMet)-specific endonuclease VapC
MEDAAIIKRASEVGESQVATCVIVGGELIYMAENSEQKNRNLRLVREFLEDIQLYPIDEETFSIYGQFKADLMRRFAPKERSKRRKAKITDFGIGENDLWIACIAIQHNLIIVSTDTDFKRMGKVRNLPTQTWYSI